MLTAIAAILACATACTGSSTPAATTAPRTSPAVRTPTRAPASGASTVPAGPSASTSRSRNGTPHAGNSRYVPLGQATGVRVVPVPKRFHGQDGIRLDKRGIPNVLHVGSATKVSITLFRGNLKGPPVGVTFTARNASTDCGQPFLAPPGHGYVVSCDVTPLQRGKVHVRLAEHNARSGEAGTSATVPIPAR